MKTTYNFTKNQSKTYWFLVTLTFSSIHLLGQTLPITPRLSPQKATQQSKVYLTKAEWFLKLPQYNLDSSLFFFDKAINVLDKKNPLHFQNFAETYFKLYHQLYRQYFTPKVLDALLKARYYVDRIPEKSEAVKLLEYNILIDESYRSNRNNEKTVANEKMLKAFTWMQEQKSPELQAKFLYDKGYLFSLLSIETITDPVKKAYQYSLESKNLYEKSNFQHKNEMLFKVYGSLAWFHNSFGQNDSCDYYFDKQKALLAFLKKPYNTAYYCSMRGNNYMRRNLQSKAIPLLRECQVILEKYQLFQNDVFVFNTYVLGVYELENKNYDGAIVLFKKGLIEAKKQNNHFVLDGYYHLSKVYEKKGDFKTALEYKQDALVSSSNSFDITLSKSLKESELKLDIAKKNTEITQKAKERNWYIGALLSGLFLLALVYRNFRLKQKSNQQLELLNGELATKNTLLDKRNAENELLLKEIHHRVKNNLEVVSSLLELQSAQIDDPAVQSAMLASQNRVHSMGIIHQKLYQGEHLAAIEMRDYFINLGENIVSSFNAEGRIKVECNMPALVLDVDTAISIGLITNELLTNSLKYAFENKEQGNINISLNEDDTEGGLILKVSDDGIGKVPDQKAKGTGFGTQLISLLTKQLDGKLSYEINNGTTVLLHFKKTKLM